MQRVVIVGMGYVGLLLARECVRSGHLTTGVDVNSALVHDLRAGVSHIGDVSSDDVTGMIEKGFSVTTGFEVVREAEVVVVCVPTPLSGAGEPDLSAVCSAVEAVGSNIKRGALVVLESTTFPGTTDSVVRPILERVSGYSCGDSVFLAFSPERIDPGRSPLTIREIPKVVGGYSVDCGSRAEAFYSCIFDVVVRTKSSREAEMSKLLENTYRHINIALVNEMAIFCTELGVDFWDVVSAAESKPYGFESFRPGPGVGGHCIPVDPHYLAHFVEAGLGRRFRLLDVAHEINRAMPEYVAGRAAQLVSRRGRGLVGSSALILGITYKADVGDVRESPAFGVVSCLLDMGIAVSFHDPYVTEWPVSGQDVRCEFDLMAAVEAADVCILLQAHSAYDLGAMSNAARLFLDTRGLCVRSDRVELL